MPPLVDWMSRHGWKILFALFAIELLFHAYAVGFARQIILRNN